MSGRKRRRASAAAATARPWPVSAAPGAGFTLLEILVAFTVAVLLLGATYELFSTGARSAAGAEHYSHAVLLAQSGLDAVAGTVLAPGESSQRIGAFERRTRVVRRSDLLPADSPPPVMPYEIEVRVSWHEGIRERSVALSTLSLGPAPPSPEP